jgi:hypothetical protein
LPWGLIAIKRDLAALPSLKGKALAERMRDHAGRVSRLMAMHEQMMKDMPARLNRGAT